VVRARSEKFMGASKYLVLGFELANTSASDAKLFRLLGRHARSLAAIDAVLFDPRIDRCPGDLEITRRLHDGSSCFDERQGSLPKL
jgi:hypothetical protein